MGIVGCRNDNQVYVGIVKQDASAQRQPQQAGQSALLYFIAAGDYRQLQPGACPQSGRMEGFARINHAQSTQHGCCRAHAIAH